MEVIGIRSCNYFCDVIALSRSEAGESVATKQSLKKNNRQIILRCFNWRDNVKSFSLNAFKI
jgi:hypothetical protein